MAGPKIYWDAHNYLSMSLCAGPPPDTEEYFDDDDERAEKLGEELIEKCPNTGVCIDWWEDPERFALALEQAAAWLRKVAAAGLTPDMFHIRTDID